MVAWRVAKSLNKLLDQLNASAPQRSKASDGSIGDAAHAATSSDHNPWIDDPASLTNVVSARDFTHDPANGADMFKISENLRLSRDPRIKYVIFHDRVFSSANSPFVWRPYSGENNHRHHMHVSVVSTKSLYDDVRDWMIGHEMPELTQDQINRLMAGLDTLHWEVRPWTSTTLQTVGRIETALGDLKTKIVALDAKATQILQNQANDPNTGGFSTEQLNEVKEHITQLETESRAVLADAVNEVNADLIQESARKAIDEYNRERAQDMLDND